MMDNLNERLKKIEDRLDAIECTLNIQPSLVFSTSSNQPPPPPPKPSPQIDRLSPIGLWLKENWLVSIGIFLIILAGVWFISYAFANDWIGETARVSLGFISGAIIYSTGLWLMRTQPRGGQALIILGEAIAIVALFAAHQVYFLLPALHAFLLMFAIVTLTASMAIKNNLEDLGLFSIIFAAIIPVLIASDSPNSIFLMLYVLIIDAAALWMWIRRGWGQTFYIAWLATLAYSFALDTIDELWIAYFFVWIFYLIFFLSIAIPIYRKKLPDLHLKGSYILLTLTFAFIFWIDSLTAFPLNVISYFIASLLLTALGYSMARNWDQIEPNSSTMKYSLGKIIGFSTIVFIFMATHKLTYYLFLYPASSELQTLSYFIEITVAIAIGYFVLYSPAVPAYLSLAFIIPLSLVWNHYQSVLYAPFLSLKFAILCTAIVSLFVAAKINRRALLHAQDSPFQELVLNLLWVLTGIFAMILVWNICHHIFPTDNIARGTALIIYIIAAEALIYVGNVKQLENLRIGGLTLILFVIFRLLTEEVWQMPIVVRTITFVIIGLLLIGTAFFDKKYKGSS